VKSLISFNRSRTWITPEFAEEFAPKGRHTLYTEEEKSQWERDPDAFLLFRRKIENSMNNFFDAQYKDSESQRKAVKCNRAGMAQRLEAKKGLAEQLIPDFAVGCRRCVFFNHLVPPNHADREKALHQDMVILRHLRQRTLRCELMRFSRSLQMALRCKMERSSRSTQLCAPLDSTLRFARLSQ
jgi:hypothetical protein